MSYRLVSTTVALMALLGCGAADDRPARPGPPGVNAPESMEPMLDSQEEMLAGASRLAHPPAGRDLSVQLAREPGLSRGCLPSRDDPHSRRGRILLKCPSM